MILPDTPWRRQGGMAALIDALDARTGGVRYVGGAVRDELLGLPVSDVDMASALLPTDVMNRVKAAGLRVVPTGIDHGTVTAILPSAHVEITTLRRDVSTDGRRATVAFSDDWREDAARRDFTINALTADPLTGEIFDYFEGLHDLRAGIVRFIGDPLQRIAEDHLRILRFFRFQARFGSGGPDPAALDACTARANDLMALSRERIADELLKLLALQAPAATVRLMVERGILRPVLPEVAPEGVARLERLQTREARENVPADPIRRLAALLPPDADAASAVAARLRLSNKASKRLAAAARWPDLIANDAIGLAYAIGRDEALDQILIRDDDAGLSQAVASLHDWARPRFPIGGGDLIAMGLPAGPIVARTLQALERQWADAGFPADAGWAQARARDQVADALRDRK